MRQDYYGAGTGVRAIVVVNTGLGDRVLRKLLFLCCSAVFASSPLALVVLDTARTPVGKLPAGWELKVNSGQPDVSTAADGDLPALRFKSVKSSFSLEKAVNVDAAQMPYLEWRWKVTQVPKGGDFRHYSTDDQAAQVLVAFDDRHILSYIWDSTAPQGTMQSASSVPLVHIYAIVCRSGTAELNRWLTESRHVAQDYLKAFGRPAPRVKGPRLQINSQHTGSTAESYFADVAFHDTPQ